MGSKRAAGRGSRTQDPDASSGRQGATIMAMVRIGEGLPVRLQLEAIRQHRLNHRRNLGSLCVLGNACLNCEEFATAPSQAADDPWTCCSDEARILRARLGGAMCVSGSLSPPSASRRAGRGIKLSGGQRQRPSITETMRHDLGRCGKL